MKTSMSDIHTRAMREFTRAQDAAHEEREQSVEDRRFYSIAGAQWEGSLGEKFASKPKFEVNKIHLSVMRIINEYLNNRITVDFTSKDGAIAAVSDTCDMLYRADEQDSNADEAYDNAFEEGVGGGFGAWRLRAVYEDDEDDENDYQRINIEPIYDADTSVYFDPNAKRQDKRDAGYCFVISSMTHEAFEAEYPDSAVSDIGKETVTPSVFDWVTPDVVYIADYYVIEKKTEHILIYTDALGTDEQRYRSEELEANPEKIDELRATGYTFMREKKITRNRVRKYIISGMEVVEDCGYIAGKYIPIVPFYGKRWYVDNKERFMGHVRLSKDAQRLKNMQLSKLAELAALSSTEKPIFTPEQIAGHQAIWSNDNIEDYPYLLVNPITDANGQKVAAPPIGYTKSPQIPPAMAALLQLTEQDMKDILGNQQAGEEMNSNISGKVVELVQNRLDMQSYIYMSNMAKAMKRCGEIWLSMARELYVEPGRAMKGVHKDTGATQITLSDVSYDEDTGEDNHAFDITKANLQVATEVGPASASRKQSTIRALMAMMQVTGDPETLQVLSSMAMMNMEGEGVEDARDFFRKKMVRMGVVKPNKEEAEKITEEQANAKPSPQDELLMAAAAKDRAAVEKTQADSLLTLERVSETRAKTAKAYADIDDSKLKFALNVADRLPDATLPVKQSEETGI